MGVTAVVGVVGVVEGVVGVVGVVAEDSGQQTPMNRPWMMQMLLRKVKKLKNAGRTQ